jgi:Fe-S oxidoreductase
MGWLPLWAHLATLSRPLARAVNTVTGTPGLDRVVKAVGGVAPQREIPVFAERRFTDWFRSRTGTEQSPEAPRGRVLLWPDSFSNHFHPAIARAAVDVLEDAGFEVTIPATTVCCGLTWISTGQLPVAQRVLRRTLEVLRPQLHDGTPVVVLEPSCAAVFRSDLPELLAGDQDAQRLAGQVVTLAELLTRRAPEWRPRTPIDRCAVAQPHCHHHAILGTEADREILATAGVDVEMLDAGCCGLAGNFGFEAGHYEVSMACAEDKLLPRLREADPAALVLADGYSCRTQIEQAGVGRTPVHLAEVLAVGIAGRSQAGSSEAELAERPGRPEGTARAGVLAALAVGAAAVAALTGTAVATRGRGRRRSPRR